MAEEKRYKTILVTGGAGFIGSHLVRRLVNRRPETLIVCVDLLTYAGNLHNLDDIMQLPNFRFERADICDAEKIADLFRKFEPDGVIHLAAESHVDRSITKPLLFAQTNVTGTLTLLDAALKHWKERPEGFSGKRFHHVSTDEVFGALSPTDAPFCETTPYSPHSPYSASKASSDHFVRAYHDTYGLPVVVTNCSNNYGPNQFPEKLIPLFINNIVNRRPLPVYGNGENVRDWLYVEDHASAIDEVFHRGADGETYCIGGINEKRNIDLVRELIAEVDRQLSRQPGESEKLITYIKDRPGHDLRYAIDNTKLFTELGWQPEVGWEEGLRRTVEWYLTNGKWLDEVTSGEYLDYYKTQYPDK